MSRDELLDSLLSSFDESGFPGDFLTEYTLMECLASRHGVETFLVQDKNGNSCIAKCYDRDVWDIAGSRDILSTLDHKNLPRHLASFENDGMTVTVREYIEGVSLDRYAAENDLTQNEIIRICTDICDILGYLHSQNEPVIHRDIKPQNVIVRPDGSIALIDFDIARVWRVENETDTIFFGTPAYAPPEQYGFSQTDARTDIYSLGILLRWLLTGSTKENKNIKVYRPLARIIRKCTDFAPENRFSSACQVKKALLSATPGKQRLRTAVISVLCAAAACLIIFAGIKIYEKATYSPFHEGAVPAFQNDEERTADAVSYMKEKYGTSLFDSPDDLASVGFLRTVLIDLYGLDRDYVYGINEDIPRESDEFFLPWGWDDGQTLDRDPCVYAAVKAHDPSIVADWSEIKDDNGYYPGVRAASAFAEKHGILSGANQPGDISVGEVAIIFANADRVFEAAVSK